MSERPPGIPGHIRPFPGNLRRCPACGYRRFDYMAEDYGACERRECGYEWRPAPTAPVGTVGSLFSGIGGLDLGLQRAGWEHRFFCEKDEWRRRVVAVRWPGVPVFGDVRDLDGDPGAVDVIAGGTPCQDLSVAGQRKGLAGEESGLFFEYARVVEHVRPRWVLFENVPGLFSSHGGRDFGVVLGTLADLGYGLAWRTFDSRFFGVPQRRRRVFLVGAFADGDPRAAAKRAGEVFAVGTRCPRHAPTRDNSREGVAYALADGSDGTRFAGTLGTITGGFRSTDLDVNAAWIIGENQRNELRESPISLQLTTGGGKPGRGYPLVRLGRFIRRLTPLECERLQGLPDGWTALGPDTKRYAGIGDSVTVSVSEWIGRRMREVDSAGRA